MCCFLPASATGSSTTVPTSVKSICQHCNGIGRGRSGGAWRAGRAAMRWLRLSMS
jgi:hypothetical protein